MRLNYRVDVAIFLIFIYVILLKSFSYAETRVKDCLENAEKIAVSIDLYPEEFVIAVSPVRQTLQIIHSTARLAGALISEVQNENFRKKLQSTVGELNVTHKFREFCLDSLARRYPNKIEEVPPLGSTAKYPNEREARLDRYKKFRNKGYNVLIDLRLTSGIYGPEGEMFFRLAGTIIDLEAEKTLWRGELIVSSECEEMKLISAFKTYFNPFKSNYFSPRLTISDTALSRWTDQEGANFFKFKESGMNLVTEAFYTNVDVSESCLGWYGMGLSLIYKGRWKKAVECFKRAVELEPKFIDAYNALIVSLYKAKRVDEAIELGEKLIEADFPEENKIRNVYFNLSYIYAKKKKDLNKAKEYYQKYIQLGGVPSKKFDPTRE
ncbi:MAG: tetratricopeptide repeat protein [Candidatus Hydrogenedentes bacterium]|nr:tetratricopeptide repeat protein [Candidatus Hydrogenedentota bacterium]